MADVLEFKIIDPREEGELWAKEKHGRRSAKIFVNGIEFCTAVAPFEGERAGAYGHRGAKVLLRDLLEAPLDGSYCSKYGVELLCCADCGSAGCWSVLCDVREEGDFVLWHNFRHNHRDWKYDISYKFEKAAYDAALKTLED